MERLQAAVEKAREQRRGKAQEAADGGQALEGRVVEDRVADPRAEAQATGAQATGARTAEAQATGARVGGLAGDRVVDGPAAEIPAVASGSLPGDRPDESRAALRQGMAAGRPRPEHRARLAADPAVTAGWKALAPLTIDSDQLRRNRLVSLDGGMEAGPFDLLRTKIIQQTALNNWHRVAIVSPHSGCGKTTTAANLAFSFARQKDLRTMFLDLDMRRPQLGQVLGQTSRFTMADVLEERVTFAEHGNRYGEQVAFGFNNESVRNSSEILQSQRTQTVLGRIEADYGADLMLFDMPPMQGSDDNFGFLKNVDCALLIVAAEKTPMDHIDVIERQLAELTNVLGVVLNKCNYTDGAYGYDYA